MDGASRVRAARSRAAGHTAPPYRPAWGGHRSGAGRLHQQLGREPTDPALLPSQHHKHRPAAAAAARLIRLPEVLTRTGRSRRRDKAPSGWHRSRPLESSPGGATAPRYRGTHGNAAEPRALERLRVYAAGVVYHGAAIARGDDGYHYTALLVLLDRLRAEAARLHCACGVRHERTRRVTPVPAALHHAPAGRSRRYRSGAARCAEAHRGGRADAEGFQRRRSARDLARRRRRAGRST